MEEATVERPKKKPRRRTIGRTSGKPWPDTYDVALRSSALLQNARPLDPLTPPSTSPPQMVSSSDSDDQWGVWRAAGARHQDASGSQRPKTPPKASGALGSKAWAEQATQRGLRRKVSDLIAITGASVISTAQMYSTSRLPYQHRMKGALGTPGLVKEAGKVALARRACTPSFGALRRRHQVVSVQCRGLDKFWYCLLLL